MRDELIYHDYAGWKLEHHDLVDNLKKVNSPLILRFEHVLTVTDFLYDKLIDDPEFNQIDHEIFVDGFTYIYDQFEEIKKILREHFSNDFLALNASAKKVNLLLNTIDFQNELLSIEDFEQTDMEFFLKFEEQIIDKLSKKDPFPDALYQTLDQESEKIFNKLQVEYYPVSAIFMAIADELGLI